MDRVKFSYRPIRMKTPAAIARIARTMLRLLSEGIKANKPKAIRKMASNRKPIFLVIFMV